jgi:predicted enzyme involved in methoxymalonyl-ACP biosynthesis
MQIKSEKPTYNEILSILNSPEYRESRCNELRIALLSNFTLAGMTTYLKYFCHREQIKALLYQGAYDAIVQEVMDPASGLYRFTP